MKIIISPSKSLYFETEAPTSLHTQPQFLEQSLKLNKKLKTLSTKKIGDLMKISLALAQLNWKRNQEWKPPFSLKNAKQAVYAFTGGVYRGLDVNSLPEEKLPVLQNKLRILSGFYGLLNPLDLIQPYRLEMGTKLKVGQKENLYKFWGTTIANALNDEMEDDDICINLASLEYFKVIPKNTLKVPMITPVFKDLKGGHYKMVMTFAKKARGLMVRYIIDNNIETVEELKGFNTNSYGFSEGMSTETEYVFIR